MATLEIYKVIPERLPLTRKRSEHLFELWTIFSWNIFVMANPPLLIPELVKRYSDPYLSHKWSEQCRCWDFWRIGISKSKWYFNIWDGGMLDISKMNSCWGPQRSLILLTNLGNSGSAVTQKKKQISTFLFHDSNQDRTKEHGVSYQRCFLSSWE